MVKAFRVLIAGVASLSAIAVSAAAPAQADEAKFLQRLAPTYVFLSPPQWVAEGYKVCQLEHSGKSSADGVFMVYSDLGVSMAAASDIVTAAVDELC